MSRKALNAHRRIVIKIGSALLVDRKTGLKSDWLHSVCADIAAYVRRISRCWLSLGRDCAWPHRARARTGRAEA